MQTPPPPPPPPPEQPDPPSPTLSWIQENVFTPRCTTCHAGAAAPEGLRLEAGVSRGMLVNVPSEQVELMRVEPGNADDSYLIHKLEGTQAVGDRMPQGGPFLAQSTINLIRQWIDDDAPDNAPAPAFDKILEARPLATMASAWPVDDSVVVGDTPGHLVLIADTELDTTLIHGGSVNVFRLDETGRTPLPANVDVTSLEPTVIRISVPAHLWLPGHYEVSVLGTGLAPVADRSGRFLDGNADGLAGGDFVTRFELVRPR